MALVHGIGASTPERWASQSVQAMVDWWIGAHRAVTARALACPLGCGLAPGHRHLMLAKAGSTAYVDLEPLFWAHCVARPSARRCATLVLRAGLLIGLVDLLAAGMRTFEQLEGGFSSNRAMAQTVWRLFALFGRAVAIPPLTLLLALAVLVVPRLRATIGDALAWSTDASSHARVTQEVIGKLRRSAGRSVVLIGHSQGGAILAQLEPHLRAPGRDLRLVTLGTGHGLLSAVEQVLPDWAAWRSIVTWTALLAYASLAIAAVGSVTLTLLSPLRPVLAAPLRIGAGAWLTHSVPASLTEPLLRQGSQIFSVAQNQLAHPFVLPPFLIPVEILGSIVALLILALCVGRAGSLQEAVDTEARGVDIVATHDLVAGSMLQLGPAERLRRVSQCGSLLLDHITYFRNGCAVLPVLAAQVEATAGLHDDLADPDGDAPMAQYHHAGLVLRGWTRPLLIATVAFVADWLCAGRVAALIWIPLTAAAVALVSAATTASSARWLRRALAAAHADPLRAVTLERGREARTSRWWALLLLVTAIPLVGGAAIAATSPTIARTISAHGLGTLTVAALLVGIALSWLAWLTLFGVDAAERAAVALLVAALVWFLRGTAWGGEMGAFMVILALCAFARTRRQRRRLAEGPAATAEE